MNSEEKKYKKFNETRFEHLGISLEEAGNARDADAREQRQNLSNPPMSKRAPAVKKCTVKETLSGHISITCRDRSFPDILPLQTVQI